MTIEKLRHEADKSGYRPMAIPGVTVALLLDVAEAMRNFCPDNKALKALDEHLEER